MSDFKEIVYDITTGETSERVFSKEETDAMKIKEQESELYKVAATENAIKKAALLAQLGITEEQAKLLLS